ncbi:MAG TPA: hypothetical protein VEX68_18235 [Bryobacteraceae bacterium]|nr:hypothetical protein [Bryobacteraceae bacterium]
MKSLLCVLFGCALAFAAVEGAVTNQTTGKPQAGVAVTLVELGSGMKNLGTTTSGPDGKFTFPVDLQSAAPHLLQGQHQGVNYNRMVPPGTAAGALTLDVFDVSNKVKEAVVTQDMFLLEPTGTEMVVSERLVYTNTGNITLQDPAGTVKFYVPAGVSGQIQVRIQAPQGMPITRPAEKASQPNTYVVRYPIKPGETNVDVSYMMPMTGGQAKFEGKILHGGGPIRFVAPSGVKLEGPFDEAGPIPGTSATAYTLKGGSEYSLTVSGSGTLRASASPEAGQSDDTGPGIDVRRPLIYDRLTWVLAFAFSMLTVGLILLFRKEAPAARGSKR